jgi:pilus assembly protein CpaC
LTVEYKDFGVSLSFTPTVIGKEQINLEMNSEVSAIDPSLSISTGNISIPGLKVRRAKTTIELKDGQSFSIAGLLQDDFQDGVSQLPGLGSIPILGALFRSSNYQHQQTELVVMITTHLVDPSVARSIASPTDAVILPSPGALFGEGKTEQGASGGAATQGSTNGFVLP